MSDVLHHPAFPEGARVTIVRDVADKRYFGVAMKGGRYVVRLPLGYDGLTSVRWINGFIIVAHPDMPPLLADTTTGSTQLFDPERWAELLNDVRRQIKAGRMARIIH